MVPRSTRRLTPLTATKPANSLVRSSVSRMNSLIRRPPGTPSHPAPVPPFRGASREPSRPPKLIPKSRTRFRTRSGITADQKRTRPDGGPSGRAFETGARGRRGACAPVAALENLVSVDPADLHGADVEAVGVVLALPAAAAILRRRSSRRRARCWQPSAPTIAAPRTAAPRPQPPRAWAALVGMARLPASVAMATAVAILDLMVMVVSL